MEVKKENWFKEIPIIETEHYYLRGVHLEDAERMYEFISDHDTMKFITPHPLQSIEGVRESIKESINKFVIQKEIPWVIIQKQEGDLIGMFRFHKLHFWHSKTEMGVVIRKDFQRKGVMTEILEKVLPFGFHTLGLNRIVGDIFAGNKGSERLLSSYGFHKDGVLRQTDFDGERYHDTVVYSLLKEEFDLGKI